MAQIVDWNKKKSKILKLCRHECNAQVQNLLTLTFQNCSKNYDSFYPLSINQIKKNTILSLPKIKIMKIKKKTCSFCVLQKRNPKVLFS
jgi:hypothetical protein